jgi:hypothetical protein
MRECSGLRRGFFLGEGRLSGRPSAYAACAIAFCDPHQPINPSPANPRAIIAQVEGSGITAETAFAPHWLSSRSRRKKSVEAVPPPRAGQSEVNSPGVPIVQVSLVPHPDKQIKPDWWLP